MKRRAIIFDMDGVLVDAEPFYFGISRGIFERLAIAIPEERLSSLFHAIVSGEEVTKGKPAPDIFIAAAQRLSVSSSNCLVIEDSHHGIAGARAAGMRTIGFLNPNSGTQDLSSADEVIHAFSAKTARMIITFLKGEPLREPV